MKQFFIKNKQFFIIILSLFCTYGLTINPQFDLDINQSFQANYIVDVFILIMTYEAIKRIFAISNKKLLYSSLIISILIAFLEVIGHSLNSGNNFVELNAGSLSVIKAILRIISFSTIGTFIISHLFLWLDKFQEKTYSDSKKIKLKHILIAFVIIFACYIPFFMQNYPGILTPDSAFQIDQATGGRTLTNHHPAIHTFIVFLCMKVGELFENYNIGVAFYSIIQMLFMSIIATYTVYYMYKRNFDKRWILITFLFYALYPINGVYSVTMWKDIPFAYSMLLLTIAIMDMCYRREEYWKDKKSIIFLIVAMILTMLFRNNGTYVVVLFLPFWLLAKRKVWKKVLLVSGVVIGVFIAYRVVVFNVLKVASTESVEALSLPLQQIARISKYNYDELSLEEKNEIKKYIYSKENMANEYVPTISDPVKIELNDENYKKDKVGFFMLCLKLAFRFPKTTILAFLNQNYGYWFPEIQYPKMSREITDYLRNC